MRKFIFNDDYASDRGRSSYTGIFLADESGVETIEYIGLFAVITAILGVIVAITKEIKTDANKVEQQIVESVGMISDN